MFRELRRQDRKIDKIQSLEILNKGIYGVLSTVGDDGYPYGIPLSYVFNNGAIYFHSAVEGKKIDNFSFNEKVSFCVVGECSPISQDFSVKYESVVVFGKICEVYNDEKNDALLELVKKYSNEYIKQGMDYIKKDGDKTRVFKIVIEHISGKARRC